MRKSISNSVRAGLLALALTFGCTTPLEPPPQPPPPDYSSSADDTSSSVYASSSSSSSSVGMVLCLFEGNCVPLDPETCSLIGQAVQSCPAASSSSLAVSSSGVAVSSSSSVVPSSSSAVPIVPSSSSSAITSGGLCAGFAEGETRVHYGKSKPQFCDSRDGKKYVYVSIGTQTWMAENLYYNASGSKCGNGSYSGTLSDANSATCDTYGRLYNWATAVTACPTGWHLPSKEEWDMLANYVKNDKSCTNCAAKHLNSASGWNGSNNGLDSYGFAALPGGTGTQDGRFGDGGYDGLWWSSTEVKSDSALRRHVGWNCSNDVCWNNEYKRGLYSVRCLQNSSGTPSSSSSSSVTVVPSSNSNGASLYCDYGYPTSYGGGCLLVHDTDDCNLNWGKLVTSCNSRTDLIYCQRSTTHCYSRTTVSCDAGDTKVSSCPERTLCTASDCEYRCENDYGPYGCR